MKKEYQEPNVEVVILNGQDVIAASPCNGGQNETSEDDV